MNSRTAEVYNEIVKAANSGQTRIAPCIFSFCFPRASVSAAFKLAKQNGVIEVAYIGGTGTPVYQAAGTKAAAVEASTAIKHWGGVT